MNKPDQTAASVPQPAASAPLPPMVLEYTGEPGTVYRDLPALGTGSIVTVDGALAKTLLATGNFRKPQPTPTAPVEETT